MVIGTMIIFHNPCHVASRFAMLRPLWLATESKAEWCMRISVACYQKRPTNPSSSRHASGPRRHDATSFQNPTATPPTSLRVPAGSPFMSSCSAARSSSTDPHPFFGIACASRSTVWSLSQSLPFRSLCVTWLESLPATRRLKHPLCISLQTPICRLHPLGKSLRDKSPVGRQPIPRRLILAVRNIPDFVILHSSTVPSCSVTSNSFWSVSYLIMAHAACIADSKLKESLSSQPAYPPLLLLKLSLLHGLSDCQWTSLPPFTFASLELLSFSRSV